MLKLNIKPSKKAADKRLAKYANARRAVKRPEVGIVKHDPMESLRAYIADTLSGFNAPALNRYETGFKEGFKEFANMLHPAGYHCDRSISELIAGLRKPSTKSTKASLQNIQAALNMLDEILEGIAYDPEYPFVDRYLCGFEDAHWLLLGLVDPPMRAAALRYLYR